MAVGISTNTANTMLTVYDTCYVQMHTGDPGAAGTANILPLTNRKQAFFLAPTTSGTVQQRVNNTLIRWDSSDLPGCSGSVTYVSLWNTVSSTVNYQRSIQLTAPAAIVSGQPAEIAASALIVNVGPVAS